jgi:hypothetical protein
MAESTKVRFINESSREKIVINYSLEYYPELKNFISGFRVDHTPYHDYAALLKLKHEDKKEIKIEIQITSYGNERQGFKRYGDVRLDLVSAFDSTCEKCQEEFQLKGRIWKTLDSVEELKKFKSLCRINKWGKLITCDADLFYFAVLDSKNKCYFMRIYNNNKLKSNVNYFINKYGIKINHKVNENWGSAFIPVFNQDKVLVSCELNSSDNLIGLFSGKK